MIEQEHFKNFIFHNFNKKNMITKHGRQFLTINGNKLRYIDIINKKINLLNKNIDTYIEPFAGTFNVFLNLKREFKKYYVCDKNSRIIQIAKSVRDCDFIDYINFWKKHFNKMQISKEEYYIIRNNLNKLYFNTDSIEEGLFYLIIHNFCINGFLRFGNQGLNASGGKISKSLKLDEEEFYFIKRKFEICELLSIDYTETLKYNSKNSFYFLDPPYLINITKNYINQTDINREQFYEFLNQLNYFLYSNMEQELKFINSENINYIFLRDMKSIKPSSKLNTKSEKYAGKIVGKEILISNF